MDYLELWEGRVNQLRNLERERESEEKTIVKLTWQGRQTEKEEYYILPGSEYVFLYRINKIALPNL